MGCSKKVESTVGQKKRKSDKSDTDDKVDWAKERERQKNQLLLKRTKQNDTLKTYNRGFYFENKHSKKMFAYDQECHSLTEWYALLWTWFYNYEKM